MKGQGGVLLPYIREIRLDDDNEKVYGVYDKHTGKCIVTADTGISERNKKIVEYALFVIDDEEWFNQCIKEEE